MIRSQIPYLKNVMNSPSSPTVPKTLEWYYTVYVCTSYHAIMLYMRTVRCTVLYRRTVQLYRIIL